jgi:site-specific recombinase XerD
MTQVIMDHAVSSWTHSPYLFPRSLSSAQPMQVRNFVVKVYDRTLKQAGVDIRTVQELMGHSAVTMTMRYAHLSPAHEQNREWNRELRNLVLYR